MKIESCVIPWLEQIKQILADYPDDLKLIEKLCKNKEYIVAFVRVTNLISKQNIPVSDEFKKVDEDLYWLLR